MPHSGPHFLRIWCDLVPTRSILGTPWRPAGAQMAPKIGQLAPKIVQVAPKGSKKASGAWYLFAAFLNVLNPQNYYV